MINIQYSIEYPLHSLWLRACCLQDGPESFRGWALKEQSGASFQLAICFSSQLEKLRHIDSFVQSLNIRPATDADHDAIWAIFHEVVAPGDTYTLDPKISREEAFAYWFRADSRTYAAESVGEAASFPAERPSPAPSTKHRRIVGTYVLRPNRLAQGAHISNASFMVASDARGLGVGRAMGEHCLNEARRLGYRAMQFNFVVSTNETALRLWKNLGFEIVGTLPGAFRHPTKGYVDAYVMFRDL